MDICIIPFVIALEIKSKFAVSPLIIHPIAINPSYFFITLDIVTGISNEPWNFNSVYFLNLILINSFLQKHEVFQ